MLENKVQKQWAIASVVIFVLILFNLTPYEWATMDGLWDWAILIIGSGIIALPVLAILELVHWFFDSESEDRDKVQLVQVVIVCVVIYFIFKLLFG